MEKKGRRSVEEIEGEEMADKSEKGGERKKERGKDKTVREHRTTTLCRRHALLLTPFYPEVGRQREKGGL